MASCSNFVEQANRARLFAPHNHIRVTHAEDGRGEGEMEIRPESMNPLNMVHGGALAALADTVAGTAAYSLGRVCVTLDSTMQYLAPGTGRYIRCTAVPKKVGRTILVYDTTLTNDQGVLVATGTFTFFATDLPDPAGGQTE